MTDLSGWWRPTVEWPKMNAGSELLANEAEPWKATMGGCHASMYIEMKDRFCFAPFLGQAAPTRNCRLVEHQIQASPSRIEVDVEYCRRLLANVSESHPENQASRARALGSRK